MSFEFTIAMVSSTLIGLGLPAYGFYQRSKLRASQNWPQTMGTITKAELVRQQSADSSGYELRVLYDYSVNGVRYTGKRIGFGGREYSRKKRAELELARYPVNSSVVVFFNPEKPSDAVLVREAPSWLIMVVSGVVLLGVVVAGLLYERR